MYVHCVPRCECKAALIEVYLLRGIDIGGVALEDKMYTARKYLPRTPVDLTAMTFTIVMVPVAYLHGVFNIVPVVFQSSTIYFMIVSYMTVLLFNTLASYWLLLKTDTSCGRLTLPVIEQPGYTHCPFCQYYAPPRSHHCPICQKCILRRDHHCFFTGRCVGYHNHRYFITFLIFVTLAAMLATVLSFCAVFIMVGGFSLTIIPSLIFPLLAWMFDMMPVSPLIMILTSLSLFVTLGAGGLLLLQLYQAMRGQTYYEFQRSSTTYQQSFAETMREIMGKNWWICWLCPLIPSPLPGNGAEYEPADGGGNHTHNHHHPTSTMPHEVRRKVVKET